MQENIKNLLKLMNENPTLEVIPMVDANVTAPAGFDVYKGSFGEAAVVEFAYCPEFESTDVVRRTDFTDEDIVAGIIENDDKLTEDEAWIIVEGLEWKKVIILYIDDLKNECKDN